MAIIDKIKLSGQTFDIQDSNASKTVELTQAEYDSLTTKDPNTYYIITDAEAVDITNYYTKSETDDLLDDKLDVTAYTPTDLSNYYTKSETSGATQIQTALNGKTDSSTVSSLNNVVTAHTADTTVHVTAQDKTNWNNKSDFSGSYNDLTNKLSAGTNITIVDNVISAEGGGGGIDSGTVQTMIDNSLSGYVYTADNGKQDIYGSKTFIGGKRISFTQGTSDDKPGFTIYGVRDAEGNASQLGAFELNPTAITESNTTFPLLSLGHYRSGNRRASVQSYIGFRQYDYDNSAAYHLLAPLPQNAKTPFSLTTNFQNFYMPLGIKVDNSTMVKADSGGVMDISSYIGSITIDPSLDSGSSNAVANSAITTAINAKQDSSKLPNYIVSNWTYNKSTHKVSVGKINKTNGGAMNDTHSVITINNQDIFNNTSVSNLNLVETSAITTSVTSSSTDSQIPSAKAVNDKLGGLSLVKLTQAEYDALTTKDSNTLYVING